VIISARILGTSENIPPLTFATANQSDLAPIVQVINTYRPLRTLHQPHDQDEKSSYTTIRI
jgi:hypothetical protein